MLNSDNSVFSPLYNTDWAALLSTKRFANISVLLRFDIVTIFIEFGWAPSHKNSKTNRLATNPEMTTIFVSFFPQISDRMSVIKNVIGYGRTPADKIKTLNPKSIVTNLLAIKLHVTNDATKIPVNIIYSLK